MEPTQSSLKKGSSASQMTAANIMDVTVRLPGCDGQAANAVSAYTQVKLEDAPKLLKIPKLECPDVWIPFHDTNGESRGQIKIPWYFLNESCTVIPWLDCHGKDNSSKLY